MARVAGTGEADVSSAISATCRKYVVTVGAIGLLPIAWAVGRVIAQPPHPLWYVAAALALLSGPLCIRIPSMQATISVSEGVIFTSALLFGPAAATVVAVIDGLAVSLWSRKRTRVRLLFGIAEPAISVCLSALLFYQLAGVPPLLEQSSAFGPLVVPLLTLTTTYFLLNTLIAGAAVWLDTDVAPVALLRQHLPHMALDFCVSLSVCALLVQSHRDMTLTAVIVFGPMLLASYLSSHYAASRLEDTSRHLTELRRLYDSTVETLAMAIDAKDQVTHGHIRRVQLLSTRLATALGASRKEVQALEAAALLHDLGKLAVPEHILNKPGPLSPAEYEEMKKHASIGASILSGIDFPFPLVSLVRHHHENWDGTGYPDGLAGDAIPVGARILAVVDCYDALTSDRPYRRRMSHHDALEIIRCRSGRMYDAAVVDAFIRLPRPTEAEMEPTEAEIASPLRRRVASVLEGTGARQLAPAPSSNTKLRRDWVTQFLATVEGADWDDAARRIASFVSQAAPESVAVLFRFDARRHVLAVAGLHRTLDGRIPDQVAVGEGVSGWVAANRRTMANADAALDLGDAAGVVRPPLRSCVSAPLLHDGDLAGVLTVYSPYAFGELDRLIVEWLAEGLPGALNAEMVQMRQRLA